MKKWWFSSSLCYKLPEGNGDMSNRPKDQFVATNYGDLKSQRPSGKIMCLTCESSKKNLRFHRFFPGIIAILCCNGWLSSIAPLLHSGGSHRCLWPLNSWLVVHSPSWKIWWSSSNGFRMTFGWHPIFLEMKNKSHVPKHQPDIHEWCIHVYPFLLISGLLELSMIISEGLQPGSLASTGLFCGDKKTSLKVRKVEKITMDPEIVIQHGSLNVPIEHHQNH